MRRYLLLFTVVLITLSTSACTWVQLNESGKQVRFATATDVIACQKIGNVLATTRAVIIKGSVRNANTIAKELIALARNQAATIHADTMVAGRPVLEGRQTFASKE